MANEKNLKPLTTEKAREIGKKGGEASAKARQAKKKEKDRLKMLLSLPLFNMKVNDASGNKILLSDVMTKFGINPTEIDNETAIAYSLFTQAMKGNVGAIKYIDERMGNNPKKDEAMRKAQLEKIKKETALLDAKIEATNKGGSAQEIIQGISEMMSLLSNPAAARSIEDVEGVEDNGKDKRYGVFI